MIVENLARRISLRADGVVGIMRKAFQDTR